MPYWCPSESTALTESEIEFAEKQIQSAFVKFDLTKETLDHFSDLKTAVHEESVVRVSLIVHTSAPWTLNGAAGVTLDSNDLYVAIKAPTIDGTEIWIVAKGAQASFEKAVGFGEKSSKPLLTFSAKALNHQTLKHPSASRILTLAVNDTQDTSASGADTPIVSDNHFNTGVQIDFQQAQFSGEILPLFEKSVFEASSQMIDQLEDIGRIITKETVQFNQPHCKRCHHAVFFISQNKHEVSS